MLRFDANNDAVCIHRRRQCRQRIFVCLPGILLLPFAVWCVCIFMFDFVSQETLENNRNETTQFVHFNGKMSKSSFGQNSSEHRSNDLMSAYKWMFCWDLDVVVVFCFFVRLPYPSVHLNLSFQILCHSTFHCSFLLCSKIRRKRNVRTQFLVKLICLHLYSVNSMICVLNA